VNGFGLLVRTARCYCNMDEHAEETEGLQNLIKTPTLSDWLPAGFSDDLGSDAYQLLDVLTGSTCAAPAGLGRCAPSNGELRASFHKPVID